jgi:exosome complex component RRP43
MGNTTIVCGVKAEISEPELDRDGDGFLGIFFWSPRFYVHHFLTRCSLPGELVPNLDLPAMCSPKFKPGPPTEEAQVLSDRLNQVLTASV